MRCFPAVLLALALLPSAASADPPCGAVEIRFAPGAPGMQIAVWIEDAAGNYVDTAYVTRLTGQFGLANRPGDGLLKTDFKWPYGRREMVLPIWAHRRNHHYPKIMMGGVCGNSTTSHCPDGSLCGGDCDDTTIAYHPRVSSYEPFYCSPSGASRIDAMSCASTGTFSKGAFAAQPVFSLYPPRADLNNFTTADSQDAKKFASYNDLVAVSQATPVDGKPIDPPVTWYPQALSPGNYVAWVELSQESDFNAANNHPNHADTVTAWDFEGHPFLGQPSVVYQVPFALDPNGSSAVAKPGDYAGYSTWDGSDGALHPPDGTIATGTPGTGAGRVLETNDGVDDFSVKVVVGMCGNTDGGVDAFPTCEPPDAVTNLSVKPSATAVDLTFDAPTGAVQPKRLSVRYHEGDSPIDDASFDSALDAADLPMPAAPGMEVSAHVDGLKPQTAYTFAVRAISPCGKGSHVVSQVVATPPQKFVTLSGCFVATAAYGSPLAGKVEALRRFRDRSLLSTPAGQLFVAAYYALSPPLARAIAADARLRALARAALQPLVDLVER
jgi:hypothetical protein